MRVLLVEDEPDLGIAIKRTLSQESYIVDWAQDGQEALDYLNDKWAEYDLTIVDWMLPRLSGLEICKHLRKKGSSIPILMLTAKDQMSDKVTGLDAGADDYLVKPFGIEEIELREQLMHEYYNNKNMVYNNTYICMYVHVHMYT